jgi:eukaryotic-like serine/threonine-protein kinase
MSDSSDGCDPLDRLVEEFLARHRAGERPCLTEYAARLPGREDEVRELFPALVELEQLKPATADGTADFTPAPADSHHPDRVGDYRIIRLVARGGMGAVYEAVQESLGRHVALKLLPADALVDPRRLERFRREAKSAARLHHTNIVPVFGVGEADGRHFYAMQFIDGHPLDAVIDEVRRLKDRSAVRAARAVSEVAVSLMTGHFAAPAVEGSSTIAEQTGESNGEPDVAADSGTALSGSLTDSGRQYWVTVARLGEQAADALAYAHAQGILHRDIKPSNLLLDLHGTVWVTDFGLAKSSDADNLTQQGDVIGTLRYLAPERFEGAGDHRADIYALGLTLYELLTLRPAFRAQKRAKLVEDVIAAEPDKPRTINPAIPRDLETIVLKAIQREPSLRYQSATELGEDLRRYVEDRPIRARRATLAEQFVRWCRRNPALAASIAAVMLAILAGAGIASFYAVRADRERIRAVAREQEANSARNQAETAAVEANRARKAASDSAEEARKRLVRLYVLGGGRYRDSGDTAAALLWFHRAWERDQADPTADSSHRTRIAGAIDELPEMLGACFHDTKVSDAVFSPDGKRVLTRVEGDKAYIWDYERSRLVAPPLVHAGRIRHITYSPDGKSVATAAADACACVWDAETGAKRFALKHDGPLTWVAFHPDGRRIATAAEDKTIRMWSAVDGRPINWTLPVAAVVEHLAFSPDGSRILIAGRDKTARVWTVDSPKPVSPALPYVPPNETERYRFNQDTWPRFAPDGKRVAGPNGRQVAYWPGGATDEVRTIPYNYLVIEVYFVPGSDRILITAAGTAGVVGLKDGKVVYLLPTPRNGNLGAVSPDGKWLLTCSSGGLVHLWDAATGKPAGTPQRCGDFCSAVTFSADGSRYLAAGQDGTVRVWATGPRRTRYGPYRQSGRANALTLVDNGDKPPIYTGLSPDGRRRVKWTTEGKAHYLAGRDATPRPISHPKPVESAVFCDDGSRLVIAGGGIVRAWDAGTLTPAGPEVATATATPQPPRPGLDHNRLSRDGTRIIGWDDPRTLSVWDLTSGRRVFGPARHPDPGPQIFDSPIHAGWVRGAALSPDGRRLAVAIESSGTLTVWDVEAGTIVHHNKRFRGVIQQMRFSDDGRRIPVFSTDGLAHLFDAASGDPLGPGIKLHGTTWSGGDLSPDAGRLAIIDRTARSIQVIDLVRGERLLDVPCEIDGKLPHQVGFDASGRSLAASYSGLFELPLPRYALPFADSAALLRFLTGQQIDENDGIAYVDQFSFMKDPDHYRDVFQAWKASRKGGE